jgi:hypothetical protein
MTATGRAKADRARVYSSPHDAQHDNQYERGTITTMTTNRRRMIPMTPVPQIFSGQTYFLVASARDSLYVQQSLRRSLERASDSLIEQHVLPTTCRRRI